MNNNLNKDLNIAGRLSLIFINHPLTFILGIFILALGYISLIVMPREENPQIKVSGGVVIVALPGAKPSEIQKVIIEPLEKKIKEIKGVENIYSFAKDSVGIVQVQYFIGQDKEESNLKLYDQVMRNMDLMPQNAMQPIIKTMDIDTDIPIATIAFYANKINKLNDKDAISQTQLYNEVSKITKEINKIKDVALVDLKGEKKEQFNVMVDANKLSAYNLSLGQVMKQIQALSYKTPNITTNTQNSSLVVFGIKQAIENVNDLENLIISYNFQTPVYLKDIAKVEKSYEIQNKKEALLYTRDVIEDFEQTEQITLTASKLKGSNSVTINKEIFAYMDSIKDELLAKNIRYIITRDDGHSK
jgi:multidrug efflux pump subunit AcrB